MSALHPLSRFVTAWQASVPSPRAPGRPAPSRLNALAQFMIFLALGLMVGGLIGSYLFRFDLGALLPVSQNSSATRQYIIAVADKYWYTLDALQARAQLSRYDPAELTTLMAAILQESKSSETRTHVAALAQALDLAPPDSPFVVGLTQPLLILAVVTSLLPLIIGVWLVVLPAWRERQLEQARRAEAAALGIPDTLELGTAGARSDDADGTPEGLGEDVVPGAVDDANQISPDTVIGAPDAGEPSEGATLPPLQPAAPVIDTEEEGDEKAAEDKNLLKDLANLFEEEDVSLSALEALVKNLPDLPIDELLTRAHEMVKQLKNFFTTRPSARPQR
ncbi:MAG: hypothetical protein HY741_05330 [Chloroflexi bacterium]|nr:hypothetical protein [Chloroflexota bacterium]